MLYIPQFLKRCTRCKELFPASTGYFHRDRHMADGLTSACAECHKQQQREYIARRSQKKTFDRVREEKPKVKVSPKIDVPAGYKACTKCEQVFPATSEYFHRDVSKADGCSSKCRQCRSNHVRQKRHENIEETREYSRSYYATHREQVKANVRASTVRHQEKRNAYENAYWQEHKEQKKAKVHRRKARHRAAVPFG